MGCNIFSHGSRKDTCRLHILYQTYLKGLKNQLIYNRLTNHSII